MSLPTGKLSTSVLKSWKDIMVMTTLFYSSIISDSSGVGRQLSKTSKPAREIKDYVEERLQKTDPQTLLAQVEEWSIEGASSCPREKVFIQREKYFKKLNFITIEELLELAKTLDFV
jgi:hypothetical protein